MSAPPRDPPRDPAAASLFQGTIAYMARNRVTANLLMALFLVGGAFSFLRITQEVFPQFEIDTIVVSVAYPGASPEEVEQGIVLVIEEAIRGVEDIIEVTSVANEGSGRVVAEYKAGADSQKIYQDVQQAVNRIRTFPEDAERPQIALSSRRRQVLTLQIYGDVSEWSLRHLAEEVRERLLLSEGVTQVDLSGAREFEIHVTPTQEALRAHGLTVQEIADRIARASVEVPAGGIDTRGGEILVRFIERRDYAREFAEIPLITTPEGAAVRLGQVAEVREAFEDTVRRATYNGQLAIGIEVFRIGDETPIGVSRATRQAIEAIRPSLPEGVEIAVSNDSSRVYEQRLSLLSKNLAIGLILVLTLLGLSLEPRLAFWVTLGIPISFLGAFLFMPMLGLSLNMMSMFAFIVALGIVVDDAIVVGENVHELRTRGVPPLEASIVGARQVVVPVTFSILTNCIAFLPLAFIPGTMGKIWAVVPLVVIVLLLISLIESLYVLPAHLSYLRHEPRFPLFRLLRWVQEGFSFVLRMFVEWIFSPVLRVCIHARYLVVAVGIALLMLSVSYALSGRMGMTLMPTVESDFSIVTATLPVGSPRERVDQVRQRLESAAVAVAETNGGDDLVEGIYTVTTANSVSTRVYLTPPGIRPIGTTAYTTLWREATGEISGLDSLRFEADRGGPGGGAGVTVELSHSNVETLQRAAEQLGVVLEQFPMLSDIDAGYQRGKEQMDFVLKPEGRALGLSSRDVARQIRNAFEGAVAIRQQRGRNEVRVRVVFPEHQRQSEYDIEQLMIRTPSGGDVPLRQIADVARGRAYTSIQRTDGRRALRVIANVTPNDMTNQVLAALRADVLPGLTQDFPGLSWQFAGRQAAMRDALSSLGRNFLLAMLVVYAMLAIPFRSYFQSLVVMMAIPFGVVGAILGHLIMGYSLSVISMMGIIALSGVVINNSLIMIVFANEKREEGLSPLDAIHAAGVRRFRPILLTTLTTFGGLAPMIFETSRQARFMIPMAISLGYGLLFATAIILLLIPSLYLILEDVTNVLRRLADLVREDEPDPRPDPEAAL